MGKVVSDYGLSALKHHTFEKHPGNNQQLQEHALWMCFYLASPPTMLLGCC